MARKLNPGPHLVVPSGRARDALLLFSAVAALVLLVLLLFWVAEQRCDFGNKAGALRLPVSYLRQEPDCVNKLLKEMGIENVRVRPGPAINASVLENINHSPIVLRTDQASRPSTIVR